MASVPVKITDDVFAAVMRDFQGGLPLAKAAEAHGVSLSGVLVRCEQDAELAAVLARSKEIHAHVLVGETLDIAKDTLDPQRARNMVYVRQWVAERLARNTYGQKVDITVDSRVSISAALEEATKRLRPRSDLENGTQRQIIDITPELERTPTDSESGDVDPFA